MTHLTYSKNFQGVADVFLRDPRLYAPLLQFIEQVMTRPSDLTKAEREVIAAHVSKLNNCNFCLGAHKWTLAAMDISPALMDEIETGLDGASIDTKLRAILDFAGKLTRDTGAIRQSDIDAVTVAGWSEQAVEDAINVTALFNYVNRLVDGFGIEGNDAYFEYIGQTLAAHGYGPLVKSALDKAN